MLILPPALFCSCSHRVTFEVTVPVITVLLLFKGYGMVVVASSMNARSEWDWVDDSVGLVRSSDVHFAWYA